MIPRFRVPRSFLVILFLFASEGGVRAQENIDQAILTDTGEKTPEVSTAELRTILLEHRTAVLDVRPFKEFAMGHIPGASNVAPQPGMAMALYISDVDQVGRIVQERMDAPIVLYCDGPNCSKTKRLANDLLAEGFTNVKRYQLGLSVWRALGGLVQMELAGVAAVMSKDQTAQFVDARDPRAFERKTLPGAINLPRHRLSARKNEKRSHEDEVQGGRNDDPPTIEDHGARVIVFGENSEQAIAVAETLAKEGYTNVSFFGGSFGELMVIAAARQEK